MAKRSSEPPGSLPRSQCSGTGPSGMHARSNAHTIEQAKSSIPALSYFKVGGMKHDQEFYAKVSCIPSA